MVGSAELPGQQPSGLIPLLIAAVMQFCTTTLGSSLIERDRISLALAWASAVRCASRAIEVCALLVELVDLVLGALVVLDGGHIDIENVDLPAHVLAQDVGGALGQRRQRGHVEVSRVQRVEAGEHLVERHREVALDQVDAHVVEGLVLLEQFRGSGLLELPADADVCQRGGLIAQPHRDALIGVAFLDVLVDLHRTIHGMGHLPGPLAVEAVVQAYAGGTAEGGHNRELAGANDGETAQEEEHGRCHGGYCHCFGPAARRVIGGVARTMPRRRRRSRISRRTRSAMSFLDSFAGSGSTRARCVKNTAPQTRRRAW